MHHIIVASLASVAIFASMEGKEVHKTFEVLLKRFIDCLLKLHDSFPNLRSLVNMIEFLQEDPDEIIS